jgi:hypothetical protein
MFRVSSAHPQEIYDVNCVCMQPLESSFSAGGHLQRRTIPVAAYIHNLYYRPPEDERIKLEKCRET